MGPALAVLGALGLGALVVGALDWAYHQGLIPLPAGVPGLDWGSLGALGARTSTPIPAPGPAVPNGRG